MGAWGKNYLGCKQQFRSYYHRIHRIIYQLSMQNNRYFISTQPTLRSQYSSPLPRERATQQSKDKRYINSPQNVLLCQSSQINRDQKNHKQNQAISFSTPNFSNSPRDNRAQKQKFYKFQTIQKINQCLDNEEKTGEESTKKVFLKKQSTSKCLYQKIHTQMVSEAPKDDHFQQERQLQRKSNKRKKCRIRSKEEFEQERQKFVTKKEKQEADDLFRHVNREMKLSLKRKEGNNFYQKIRKNAIKKINYMSYNQKYYDNSEVKHLNSVIENCNILIHKRDCKIDAKPLYQTLKHRQFTQYKDNYVTTTNQSMRKLSTQKDMSNKKHAKDKASISKGFLEQTQKESVSNQSQTSSYFKYKSSQQSSRLKVSRIKQQNQLLNTKMAKIVNSCSREQLNMKEVKKGLKIFEFYCSKVDQGFSSRQNKLNNFLKWEEVDQ